MLRRRDGGRQSQEGFVLRLQGVLDIAVQLLVRARCFRSVQVAASYDLAVGCVEVQRAGDVVEIAKGEKLHRCGPESSRLSVCSQSMRSGL